MSALNRVLNVLVLVAAVTATAVSFRLYRVRRQARARADRLAAAVNQAMTALDDSTRELDWQAFARNQQACEQSLDEFTTAAEEMRRQRDQQIETIAAQRDEIHKNQRQLAGVRAELAQAEQRIARLQAANDLQMAGLHSAGKACDMAIDRFDADTLASLRGRLQDLDRRAALVPVLRRIRQDLEDRLDKKERVLAGKEREILEQSWEIVALKKMVDSQPVAGDRSDEATTAGDEPVPVPDATVVKANYDYNFVILDKGRADGMPEDVVMTIAREREYISFQFFAPGARRP